MESVPIIVVAVIGFLLFFFILKRLLRFAIRLAVFGAILVAILAGAIAWWWYDPLGTTPNQNRNTTARPARSPR